MLSLMAIDRICCGEESLPVPAIATSLDFTGGVSGS